jgi:hypothetical protein
VPSFCSLLYPIYRLAAALCRGVVYPPGKTLL